MILKHLLILSIWLTIVGCDFLKDSEQNNNDSSESKTMYLTIKGEALTFIDSKLIETRPFTNSELKDLEDKNIVYDSIVFSGSDSASIHLDLVELTAEFKVINESETYIFLLYGYSQDGRLVALAEEDTIVFRKNSFSELEKEFWRVDITTNTTTKSIIRTIPINLDSLKSTILPTDTLVHWEILGTWK